MPSKHHATTTSTFHIIWECGGAKREEVDRNIIISQRENAFYRSNHIAMSQLPTARRNSIHPSSDWWSPSAKRYQCQELNTFIPKLIALPIAARNSIHSPYVCENTLLAHHLQREKVSLPARRSSALKSHATFKLPTGRRNSYISPKLIRLTIPRHKYYGTIQWVAKQPISKGTWESRLASK